MSDADRGLFPATVMHRGTRLEFEQSQNRYGLLKAYSNPNGTIAVGADANGRVHKSFTGETAWSDAIRYVDDHNIAIRNALKKG